MASKTLGGVAVGSKIRGAATGACGTTAATPGILGGVGGLAAGSDLGESLGLAAVGPGPMEGARTGIDGGRGNALRTGGGGVEVASPANDAGSTPGGTGSLER
ncbi:MAG: hypothetical protein ABUL60_06570 [Myxococcales bacterium]